MCNTRCVSDAKGGPELQAGHGPEKGHAAAPGPQKHGALPRWCCQEREGLQQIQGDPRQKVEASETLTSYSYC